jgi:ABC-type transport system involved in multi-copper enzyme maturation permease subunit
VAILGFLILIGAGALGIFGVEGLGIFIKDLAAGVLSAASTIVAVMISSRIIPEEIRQRTLYPLLSRPVSRLDLLIGKLLGAIVVSWFSFLLLAALTGVALLSFHIPFELVMVEYLAVKLLGIAVVCALGLCLSTFMTPAAASTLALVLSFGSSMISRALFMAGSGQPSMQWLYKVVNGALPQVHLFDLGALATYGWPPLGSGTLMALFAYGVLYSAALLAVAWLKFRKQAI